MAKISKITSLFLTVAMLACSSPAWAGKTGPSESEKQMQAFLLMQLVNQGKQQPPPIVPDKPAPTPAPPPR